MRVRFGLAVGVLVTSNHFVIAKTRIRAEQMIKQKRQLPNMYP